MALAGMGIGAIAGGGFSGLVGAVSAALDGMGIGGPVPGTPQSLQRADQLLRGMLMQQGFLPGTGNPAFGRGVSGANPLGGESGVGGGPAQLPSPDIIPFPKQPKPAKPPARKIEDELRRRVGRQETILTARSALAPATTSRPTLLGL